MSPTPRTARRSCALAVLIVGALAAFGVARRAASADGARPLGGASASSGDEASAASSGSAGSASAAAETSASSAASSAVVEVSADRMDVDARGERATLVGRVVVRRGAALTLRAPRVDVKYAPATGGQPARVVSIRACDGVELELAGTRARASEASLDWVHQGATLTGNVRVARGDGWLSADSMEIDLVTGALSLRRVRASIPIASIASIASIAGPAPSQSARPSR